MLYFPPFCSASIATSGAFAFYGSVWSGSLKKLTIACTTLDFWADLLGASVSSVSDSDEPESLGGSDFAGGSSPWAIATFGAFDFCEMSASWGRPKEHRLELGSFTHH